MKRVLIAGGGFGGFYAARRLERLAPKDVRITLINDVNFMLYTPLLPGAAAGTLEPRHVVVPLRERLERTELRLGWVIGGDPANSKLEVELIAGHTVQLDYHQLVVALGSVSRTFPIPGLAAHAIGFKTIAEAIALRNRLVRFLETAEEIDEPERRRPYLNFVFVGAGYAGLEGVAELQDFALDALAYYPRCREVGTRWILVDAAPRIMPQIQPQLARFTEDVLRRRGIEIMLETQLTEVTDESVTLTSGETIPCRTVCWTAGVKASPVAERLGLPLEQGRIACDERMRVRGHHNVWAIGDVAAIPDPARPGEPCPPTAQHAIRQGKLIAGNVAAALGDPRRDVRPFAYKTRGMFADLGRHNAVANVLGGRLKGFPAWALCRFYHLAWVPGIRRKIRLIADWTVDFWFRRDTAELGQLGHPPGLEEHMPPSAETGDGLARARALIDRPGG
ncbi:MAG: NAD(P)/FAD-dependent oxidoreductase [Solirubrobacterales bacterium]|nr:NAD(P)/FAD-dependent oxidoreductase [Solirubrobacterales bacterium]MBV9471458.1 NAD(P)/FAD-dependent oxidoreductase [Solirubrobacterales bacterium]